MIVLDACVLIAFTDRANAFHRAARQILATADTFAITALTGAEVMVYPLRAGLRGWYELLDDLGVDVVPISAADMLDIAATRRESGLTMPDALVLWVARRYGATVATYDDRLLAQARAWGMPTLP